MISIRAKLQSIPSIKKMTLREENLLSVILQFTDIQRIKTFNTPPR